MKIFIDATNIKAGGGLTHLKNLVENHKEDTISLVGGDWLAQIEPQPNLKKLIFASNFKSILKQEIFKRFKLESVLKESDIAFIPGGTFSSKKTPYVSMSQNMLVFEDEERNRFPKSLTWMRYKVLERLQVRSFKNSKGIIYISNYAKDYIENKYPSLKEKPSTVIYHGISTDFRQKPKIQKPINTYSKENPFIITYISIVNFYKHQWNIIEAVKTLVEQGYPIKLELIGPMYEPVRQNLEESLIGTDNFVEYKGKVPYEEISNSYKSADLFVFASTCENMPNILVEAMSAGLPILCSNYGPMPEVLKDAGEYMNPLNVDDICKNLKLLLDSTEIRQKISEKAYIYSQDFSWNTTANQTFNFIKSLA
ncbi:MULTISPECIES: glycosyltransferase family 4 protein [Croceibacter]|uniref:glycosyltransferase family 4 protein n=1 Tax=Croceibacter TaxID=216431 RepID=UPI000C3844B6|nr:MULTISPECIES: glycosyltransferase family 1 protein [Croceibacter]MBG24880.1 glycosyl transferase [Croceibacter sp.]